MRIITGQFKGRHFDIPRTFKARPTTDFAKENIFNVLNGYIDFFRFLKSCRQKFDLIFADPPYALPELETIPNLIFEQELLSDDGIFVFEHGKQNDFSANPHFKEHRTYGSVNFSIFK